MTAQTAVEASRALSRPSLGARLIVAGFLTIACDLPADAPVGAVIDLTDLGEHDAGPVAVPEYVAVEEMRINGHAAELVPIQGIAVASDGTIAVMQRQDYRVVFFSPDGDSIGSVGRRGGGPGEFRSAPLLGGWVANDTLWLHESSGSRLTLVTAHAEHVRTIGEPTPVRPPPEDSARFPRLLTLADPRVLYPDGSVVVESRRQFHRDPPSAYPPGWGPDKEPWLRVKATGAIDRVVAWGVEDRDRVRGVILSPASGGVEGMWISRLPFSPEPTMEVSPDGARIVTLATSASGLPSGVYSLTMQDSRGDSVFTRTVRFPTEPIPGRALDSASVAAVLNRVGPGSLAHELRRRMPLRYPAVERMLISNDHRVWLGLRPGPSGRPWLVLDSDGEWWGRVVLPQNTRVGAARGSHVWAIARDAYDVPSVIRYRLEAAK